MKMRLTPAVTKLVVLIGGLAGVGATIDLLGSPAWSARVLRLNSGSATAITQYTFSNLSTYAGLLHPPILCFTVVGGAILDGGKERAFARESEMSWSPFSGDGIRLGWRNPEGRIIFSDINIPFTFTTEFLSYLVFF